MAAWSARARRPAQANQSDRPARTVLGLCAAKVGSEFPDDRCTDLAAGLTCYAVLSLFPAAIAVVSLLGVVGQGSSSVNSVLGVLRQVGASGVADTIRPSLLHISRSPTAGLGLVLGVAAALWSASGCVGAFGRAMNRIYEIGEGRPFWKLRPLQMLVTLAAVVLIALVAVSLVVTGPLDRVIGSQVGMVSTAVTAFSIAKWPVIVPVAVLIIAMLYYATPNVQQPKFRWMSVGAFVALVAWVVASVLFGIYLASFGSYDKTYGSLAGVVVFLLWLWITNLALLYGAELDSELERSRQLQAGLPAEDTALLPARDQRALPALASWLEAREPGQLIEEVKSFARQRPGVFLGIAAAAGVVVGRLGRGLKEGEPQPPQHAATPGYRSAVADPTSDASPDLQGRQS